MATFVEAIRRRRFFYGWWIAATAFLGLFVSAGASSWAFSIIAKPMSEDLSWTRSQTFLVVTVSGVVGGLTSPLIGRLVDRHGAKTIIVISSIVSGMLLVLCGWVTSLWQLIAIFGIGRGIVSPGLGGIAPNAAVANWFVRKRGRVFATLSTGVAISGMVFPPLVTWIIAISNWRVAWIALGIITVVLVAPIAWYFMRRRPEDMGLKPDGEEPKEESVKPGAAPVNSMLQPMEEFTAKEALRTRTFWLLTIAFALTGVPAMTIFLHLPLYFTDQGISAATAAGLTSLYAFGAFMARGVWGVFGERVSIQTLLVSQALLYAISIILFTLVGTDSLLLLYVPMLLLGIAAGGGMQLDNQAWADYYGRREIGTIMGYWNFFRVGFSSGGPLFAAWMFDLLGSYTVTFGIFAVFCLLAGIVLIFAKPPRKRVAEAAA